MTHPYFAQTRHPRVLAHRGLTTTAGGDSPVWENTAGAFAAAHAAGAQYIETDCRVTADGAVVLFHDATLARLLGDPRPVSAVRSTELAELLAPHGGLLTVAEALGGFPEMRFNIDLKVDEAVEPLAPVLAAHAHRVLVTSFSDARRERAVAAVLRTGAPLRPATSAGQRTIAAVRAATLLRLSPARALVGIDALQIPERFRGVPIFTPALVRAAQRRGVEVHVWTINDPDRMMRLVSRGADGIVTDRADVALDVLDMP